MASILSCGVTSNDGFQTSIPTGAILIFCIWTPLLPWTNAPSGPTTPPMICVSSFFGRCSITISSPVDRVKSIVVVGAAPINLIDGYSDAISDSWNVPILLARSPFLTMRSAPTMMNLIGAALGNDRLALFLARESTKNDTMLSVMRLNGIFSYCSSYAVSREPWLYGRVSHAYTWAIFVALCWASWCNALMIPRAVP
ncbi:hypothetical protein OGAPHI_003111 [Ogataea philodendri]|uniref:Uncharacterized protein n=1 Tax=Ogataea philodendri TaxID=1378263 RepID=A0A9P8P8X0_9ASCO|nr:uncharacterized protein OGAPHI_003111 [Ogataea philodendri]KAH3667462.1 hypothetical protein OGAPHI_003111 [Ogataea philodendri]